MELEVLRILGQQRALYDRPRDMARFREYLHQMTAGGDDLALPIVGMNPMGKDKAKAAYDSLLAIRAEDLAENALVDARRKFALVPGRLRLALVVQDDAQGSWSHPEPNEASAWESDAFAKRGFAAAHFLSSRAPYEPSDVAPLVLATVYQTTWILRRGPPKTVRELLIMMGQRDRFSGRSLTWDPNQFARSEAIIERHGDSKAATSTAFSIMFGDDSARTWGHAALGLPARAGFEVGLALAIRSGRTPESYLI